MLPQTLTPHSEATSQGGGDLDIRRVRLRGQTGLHVLQVRGGQITAVLGESAVLSTVPVLDVDGSLVVPGLVEAHIHLEKAFLLDRAPREARTLAEAISVTAEMKASFTPEDMRERALRVLRTTTGQGVTALRCQVEVDDVLGLSAVETMLNLREEVAGVTDLQICVFPQEGIFQQREAQSLMREAMNMGADVVGGIPYNDLDVDQHLDFVFDLAAEFDAPLDFHIDLSDDPSQRDIVKVVERTRANGMQGRVVAGHLTSLGSVPAAEARGIAADMADAGVSVIALPVTDVFLNGRNDAEAPRRGITPVRLLLQEGVNVAVATNNVQNPFTPFGRGRVLDAAWMIAGLCHMATAEDAETLVDMVTTNASRAIGFQAGPIEAGRVADLAVFDTASARGMINECSQPSTVIKAGRIVTPEELPL